MKKIILFLVCLFLTAGIYAQQIVYVNASATGANNGTSWADAFTDFQAGVNAAASGEAVFVAKGIYQPASGQSFSMKGGVKIYGGFAGTESSLSLRNLAAGDTSVLQGNGASVIRNDIVLNTTTVLDGFKITGGIANQASPRNSGGGIYNGNNSSPLLTNLIITENSASYGGGGMYNFNGSSPVLFNVAFSKNSALNGGAIFNSTGCSPRIINTTFWKNAAPSGGGAMYNFSASAPVLINVIMWGNELYGGGDGPSASIYNAFQGAQPVVSHSLIAHSFGSGANWAYYVGTDGGGNIDTDPKFMDPANGNFGLKIRSLAINAGDNAAIPVGYSSDLAGDGRVFNPATGGVVDMGAYEYQGNPLRTDGNGTLYVNSTAPDGGDGSSWAKALQSFGFALNGGTILNTEATTSADSLRQIWVAKGTYQPDTTGHSFFMLPKVKIYGGFAGTEGSLAQRDLTAADTSILKGNGSSVIQNIDNGLDSNSLLDGFCITGGHPSGMTTSDGSGGGILNHSVSPILSHLIIKDNSASMGGGMFNFAGASPFITDVIITGNTAQTGGGIENSTASPVLRNVSITANSAENEGGGMYNGNSASPVLMNVLISGNKVTSGFGGAITNYNHASPSLTNVTMSANTASSRGGAMHNYIQSFPILTNCIIWGNSAVSGQQIWNSNATTVSFHYCLYAGGPDDIVENDGSATVLDAHSITVDPEFADASNHNYQLSVGSPAINAGVSDSITADNTTDLAGKPRIFNKASGGVVDMGAYEYQAAVLHPGTNGVLYVDSAAATGGDGSSWATAVAQLADALKAAAQINSATPGMVKEIWVTSGTYYPLYTPVTELDNGDPVSMRDRTFMLVQDVPVYGGFNGTEISAGERSPVTGKGTVLSGDIGLPGDLSDNTYHVVTAIGDGTKVAFSALGNLTITGGNANGASSYSLNGNTPLQRQGGGVYLGKANLAFTNCLFTGNRALKKGGAIMNVSGAISVSNSTYIVNCTFADNDAEAGKAIYNYQTPTPILVINSIVLGDIQYEGPAPVVDFSLVEGRPADPAYGDLDGSIDPQFEDASSGDYRLKAGSPAINAGSNAVIDMTVNPVDLDGYPRITDYIMGGTVEMGAYEFHNTALPVKMSALSGVISNSGHAILSWKSFSEINNKGFQIQYSTDGVHFENSSFIPSKAQGGNSTKLINYSADENLLRGIKYYRLAQISTDSKIAYSNVIRLEATNTDFGITAYPNPAHNFVSIHIDAAQSPNGEIMIVSQTGRILKHQNITSADSKIDLSGLSTGFYILKYTDGKHKATLKIIKE